MFVVVGVTGGIAAYKTVQLVRLLVLAGHDVHVVPTDAALRFVGTADVGGDQPQPRDDLGVRRRRRGPARRPRTCGRPRDRRSGDRRLPGEDDGGDRRGPPRHDAARHDRAGRRRPGDAHRDVAASGDGAQHRRPFGAAECTSSGPADGPLTGGDSGPGRMSEPEAIVRCGPGTGGSAETTCAASVPSSPRAAHASPSIRCGSSAIGRAAARASRSPLAAADRGADVTLIVAHVDDGVLGDASSHPRIAIVRVQTAAELAAATRGAASGADVIVMAAAVADYRAAEIADLKRSKEDAGSGRASRSSSSRPRTSSRPS